MPWINNDGLLVRYASEEAVDTAIGEYGIYDAGSTHLVQLELNPEVLDAVGKKVHTAVRLPGTNGKTCYLKEAEIFVEEAFVGSGFTLDIGLDEVGGDVFDADGIDAAVATGALTADATIVCDGALVGTRLTNDEALYVTTTVNTAAPTAGKAWLRIWFYLTNE